MDEYDFVAFSHVDYPLAVSIEMKLGSIITPLLVLLLLMLITDFIQTKENKKNNGKERIGIYMCINRGRLNGKITLNL